MTNDAKVAPTFAVPTFAIPPSSLIEPGDNQRWSTWPAVTAGERGPRPWPEWLVTASAAFDTELGIVKSGKEADLYLIERAVPGDPTRSCLLAAKRYRGTDTSDFHRSSQYQEGRSLRRSRDARAVARGSRFGRVVASGQWALAEFQALCALYAAGIAVPYPVQLSGTELLMEYIGDGIEAAPRLAQSTERGEELSGAFEQLIEIMLGFARSGFAHGDLSAYNLLWHRGKLVVIDLPQLVDVASNPTGMDLLHRDCRNVCDWFARRGLVRDADELFGILVAEMF